jgi:type II secretory pathway pseudopilin PulG
VTTARIVVCPFNGSTVRSIDSVSVEPVGDVSGTVSQAMTAITVATATNANRIVVFIAARTHRPWTADVARERNAVNCCTEEPDNDNRRMELAGQPFDFAHGRGNRGYAMAALLVGMSVMAVLMSALLPVWTTMAKREKEAELVFRGNQYARAVGLFQRKFANAAPPTIDVLVEQRFLRKKYKDPITNADFQPIYANQAMMPGVPGGPAQQSGQQRGTPPAPGGQLIQPGFGATGATAAGGIIGVTSKSKETSLKVFNGRTRYNEWAFVHVQTSQRPGQPGGGGPAGFPGGANQRPGPGGPAGPSPFGMPPGSFPNSNQPPNPNQRQGMPMQPPGFGPSRPPMPGGAPFGTPQGPPFNFPQQPQRPGQRPPGQ